MFVFRLKDRLEEPTDEKFSGIVRRYSIVVGIFKNVVPRKTFSYTLIIDNTIYKTFDNDKYLKHSNSV